VKCVACKTDQPRTEFGPSAEQWPSHRECKTCTRTRVQVRRHGLTADQKRDIAIAQGGCAICGHGDPGPKGWVLDHDRQCCQGDKSCPSCRRGVLCHYCNSMLGYAFDRAATLEAALHYLLPDPTCKWHAPIPCSIQLCGRDA
jgi:hypothetical protein